MARPITDPDKLAERIELVRMKLAAAETDEQQPGVLEHKAKQAEEQAALLLQRAANWRRRITHAAEDAEKYRKELAALLYTLKVVEDPRFQELARLTQRIDEIQSQSEKKS